MATQVYGEKIHTWSLPASWNLEEACAVPLPYSLAYLALVIKAKIDKTKV